MAARSKGAGTEADSHILFRIRQMGMYGNFSRIFIPDELGSVRWQFGGIALSAYHAVEPELIVLLYQLLALVGIPARIRGGVLFSQKVGKSG